MNEFVLAAEKEMLKSNSQIIQCPCIGCVNNILHGIEILEDHLFRYGFIVGYTCWTKHGEDAVMGEGNNPGCMIQHSEPGHIDIEYNRMDGMESPQQNAECKNPNRSEQNRDCEMPSYDDDMPDFDAMLGDFEGTLVPRQYKAMATLKVDARQICIQDAK